MVRAPSAVHRSLRSLNIRVYPCSSVVSENSYNSCLPPRPNQPLQPPLPPRAWHPHRLRIREHLRVTPEHFEPGLQPVLEHLVPRRIKPRVQGLPAGINDAAQPIPQPPPQIHNPRQRRRHNAQVNRDINLLTHCRYVGN